MSAARILVVDDEDDIRTILVVTLRRAGYEVASAGDGVEAVEAIQRKAPDLILLDVMMPRADGLETLKRIRQHAPTAHVPVIMLTARSGLTDKMRGFERGVDDYVGKPFEPAEVLARVAALLKRSAQARAVSPLLSVLGDWFTAERMAQLGRDLEAARDIQERLLPPVPATLVGLEAGAMLRSSTVVGGDFFDLVPMGDRIGVAVGDVSGKGIPAALLMVMTRTLLRAIARDLEEPGAVLSRLNRSLCLDMPPSMFVTLILAVLDPRDVGGLALSGAGHPDPATSVALLRGIDAAGADVIELGVPFSDPMADGPIIQASSQRALDHGMTLGRTLDLIRDAHVRAPIVLFTYLNPLLAAGADVLDRAAAAGAHGVLVTDLPVGADPVREQWLGSGPLGFVRLVAPTTPLERMREITAHGSGFVYLISRRGVTGLRTDVPAELPGTIARLRQATTLPVCVGFGISTADQARAVGQLADGIVVGSAIVQAADKSVDAATELVSTLRRALDTI